MQLIIPAISFAGARRSKICSRFQRFLFVICELKLIVLVPKIVPESWTDGEDISTVKKIINFYLRLRDS